MPEYSKFYEARKIITDILEEDLVGPVDRNEIIPELPTQYYIMGKLYPQSESGDVVDLARNPVLENAVETYDASISLSNQKNPSSMGITCALKTGVKEILLTGSYAFYSPVFFEEAAKFGLDISKWDKAEKKPKELWLRKEYQFENVVRLGNNKISEPILLEGAMQLQVYTHNIVESGERIVTIAMVNTNQTDEDSTEKARLCAFQPELKIQGVNHTAIFANVNRQEQISVDDELVEMELLYSDVHCYGQGHGCSVEWDLKNTEPLWVKSAWLPSYNLHQMMAAQIEDNQVLSMKYLAFAKSTSVIESLRVFVQDYGKWINQQEKRAKDVESRFRKSASSNIQKCRNAFLRMSHSIDLLEKSLSQKDHRGDAFKAFQLSNEAMLLQRKQTLLKAERPFNADDVRWYPFQLAFILQELPSFIDPESEDRKIVDLLWFPTGGGKTEAYLGIAAFAIFLRRIRNSNDDGVTVIMRYTLRLLTLQQFERASVLICACELLRRKYKLGGEEISIGLWVGGKLTPNSLKEAQKGIRKVSQGEELMGESNPCQIQVCPWCGQPLLASDYEVNTQEKRMVIHCGNKDCAFRDAANGLPVHIIDEAIYEHLPTFIVATVDKFAQIPLSEKPASLFGISNGKNPPDMIIQDELHLISGPLGTITGIYEAAITKLCERNGIGAKIIASTATIRNAKKQILALYGKTYSQFPPQGLTAKDSYFAVESTPDNRPARKYFGVMGVSTTATTTLIRVNAALLFASRYLVNCGFDDKVIDNFWTITGYFNSLRELGGASTQILDDVQSRFNYLAKTKFAAKNLKVNPADDYTYTVELIQLN